MSGKPGNQTAVQSRERMLHALLDILETKPFSAVTVSELAAAAGVSRMTYYRNYNSMEDVFRKHFSDMIAHYRAEHRSVSQLGTFHDIPALTELFSFFKEERVFLKALFTCGFGVMLLSVLDDYATTTWGDIADRYEIAAFTGALFSMCRVWEKDDFANTPRSMAERLHGYFNHTKRSAPRSALRSTSR